MKGKFLATTLCITGLAIIVLPTSHSDASWATQYLKNNGYGAIPQSKSFDAYQPLKDFVSTTTNVCYSYYYRQYRNTKLASEPTPITVPADSETKDNEDVNGVNYNISQDEEYMLQLINSEREKLGIEKLTMDASLAKLARIKSEDMAQNNYFNHQSPTYGSLSEMLNSNGISYQMAAENIAKNSSVYKAHMSLMASEGHKANILNPSYNKVGIGIVKDGSTYIFTQIFIKD
ncbi:CAP domain-containing protein [Calorimonas adulescens]|jgi:Cysteine-rich secretory protein family.|uniref:Serine protease n=1 Tax=Calorimonas adulescens TaxID=2606906 RepID=A0A5D8QDN1_9THEO|nr:CAP domain-containing protein [Calorimonas adulescens]TZE82269.1 serine protease [Calorimonas adulescens]